MKITLKKRKLGCIKTFTIFKKKRNETNMPMQPDLIYNEIPEDQLMWNWWRESLH